MAKILVVDDDGASRRLLVALLEHEAHVVLECENGRDGLASAIRDNPDLVITDCSMAVMDGDQFVAELRKHPVTQSIPVMFYTATSDAGQRQPGNEGLIRQATRTSGAVRVLAKPCSTGRIVAEVSAALGVGSLQPGPEAADDIDLLASRAGIYLANREADVAVIEAALTMNDLATIQRAGHNMKGTGAAYGFARITDIGGRFESAAQAGDRVEIRAQLVRLAACLGDLAAVGSASANSLVCDDVDR